MEPIALAAQIDGNVELIAQIIGYLATAIVLITFQFKTQKSIIIFQFFSTALFTVHFYMMKLYAGALLNAVCAVRAIVFSQRDKKWAGHPIWIGVFIFLTVVSYFISVLFLKEDVTTSTYFIELLPVFGNVITTIGMRLEANMCRRYTLCASPLWLIYNIKGNSQGGIITEVFSSISIIIGMLRLDRKKK